MDFIKKHYEKLILLLLLVIFIASMFHVLNIIKQTGEITDDHLQIPTRDPDYKIHAVDDPIFNVTEQMKKTVPNWVNPGARVAANADHYSDLVQVFEISRCPFCEKLIPRSYMEQEKVCPLCKNEKGGGEPFKKPRGIVGFTPIPAAVLQAHQLDPNDPDAQYYDIDGDGFSNVYEYQLKIDFADPRKHPPLWHRLQVVNVGKMDLPIRLTSVNTLDNDDPKMWELQIHNGTFNDLYMIGSELEIEGVRFRIESAESKKDGGKDMSVVHLKATDGDQKISMQAGVPIKSMHDKAILKDSANPNWKGVLSVGDQFTIGNYQTGTESYRVKSFDTKEKTVLLENPSIFEGDATKDATGLEMRVTTFGQVHPLLSVKERKLQDNYGMDMGGPQPGRPRPNYQPRR